MNKWWTAASAFMCGNGLVVAFETGSNPLIREVMGGLSFVMGYGLIVSLIELGRKPK